jgi:hypothetical protein
MEKVHTRAIKELEGMGLDPVDRIVLAAEHNVPAWLNPAYVELCTREDPLREEEVQRLGLITTWKLMCAREKIRASTQAKKPPAGYRCGSCSRDAPSPHYCRFCGAYSVVPHEHPSTASQGTDATLTEQVVGEIFQPTAPTTSPSTT